MERPAYTSSEAARRLDVSVRWIHKLTAAGRLPYVRTPLGRLIDAEAVEKLRSEREVAIAK